MTLQSTIQEYYGDRYFALRSQLFEEWKREAKERGVSSRFYVNNRMQELYDEDNLQIVEEDKR